MSQSQTKEKPIASPVVMEALDGIRSHKRGTFRGPVKAVPVKLEADTEVEEEALETCREGFKRAFGEAIGADAFKIIDKRLEGGKEVRGEHIQAAGLAAMEMVSPLIRFAKRKERADADVKSAMKGVEKAKQELTEAEANAAEKQHTYEQYGGPGVFAPGIEKERQEAKERLDQATKALAKAEKWLDRTNLEAGKAASLLETCQKSLNREFEPGEDALALEKEIAAAKEDLAKLQKELAEAQEVEQAALSARLKSHGAQFGDMADWERQDKVKQYQQDVTDHEIASEKAAVSASAVKQGEQRLKDAQDGLSALEEGPALRRTQALLDNLGDDPRLAKLMEEQAPHDNAVKAYFKKLFTVKGGAKMIPLVGLGVMFKEAVDAEDQERGLNGASKQLGGKPGAKALCDGLSRGKEMQKWQSGLEFTIGFVATGASFPGASGVGAALQPVTGPVSSMISQAVTQPLVAQGLSFAATTGINMAVTKPITIGTSKLAEKAIPDDLGKEAREGADQGFTPEEVPEGTAAPFVPGKDGQTYQLSDPRVAEALVEYLGPKQDTTLTDPAQIEAEERRMRLREEMFGTGRDVDLRKGMKADDTDKQVMEELNQGSSGKSFPQASKTDPLRLMYAALGWMS